MSYLKVSYYQTNFWVLVMFVRSAKQQLYSHVLTAGLSDLSSDINLNNSLQTLDGTVTSL